MNVTRAVVLARGLGTRMRSRGADGLLTDEQKRAADAGIKAMMPIGDRPFLDFILSALADGGIERVAIVVAPGHDLVRRYYSTVAPPVRLHIDFVVQEEPRGTADAVLSAEAWAVNEDFVAINGDNLYPGEVIRAIASADEPAVAGFDRAALVHSGNIEAARIDAFALIQTDDDGYLMGIVEKPRPEEADANALVSMNCWRFDARIFDACRNVAPSPRAEYELPLAVSHAMHQGVRFRVVRAYSGVLDLSQRADAAVIARRLAGTTPTP